MRKLDREIGTVEAGRLLGIHKSNVRIRAIEVDLDNDEQVAAALKSKRLPGHRILGRWLFRREHVRAFGRIERPTGYPAGRPRNSAA